MRTIEELVRDTTPFPEGLVEALPGRGGGPPLDYVAWYHYAQRLLAQHGGHRYSVTNMVYDGQGTWAVSVRLQFSDDEWYDGVGEDSSPNSAESNAYKRACAHAGIGLHLYGHYWLQTSLTKEVAE